MFTPQNNAQ